MIGSRTGPGRLLVVATVALAGLWTVFAFGPAGEAAGSAPGVVLGVQLHAAGATVGIVAATLCVLRWRLVGDAAALWFGAAALLLAGSLIETPVDPPGPVGTALAWLPVAMRVTAIVLLWRAARTPEVDTALRPPRVVAATLVATAGAVALFLLAPGLGSSLASVSDRLPSGMPATGSAVLAIAWSVLAFAHARRGRRDRNWLRLWFALVLLALALTEVSWLLPSAPASPWATGPAVLAAYAMLCAAAGATWELARAFNEQRGRLFETVTSELAAEAKVRAEQLLAQERAHEARNALTAIEGASRTLETYRDRLDPETRISLSRAISNEIARLQRLVSPEETARASGEFRLADTLTSVVVGARAQGMTIEMQVPQFLACGRPGETAEVVQNLIENARRYAPSSPVVVRAQRQHGGIVVRVEDRGPGVAGGEREAIFARGYRGRDTDGADGSGLGLYICARLMREQGGDLWVEDRPGGGASFALWLPEPAHVPAEDGAEAEGEPPQESATGTASDPGASNVVPLFGARAQQHSETQGPPAGAAGGQIGTDALPD